MYQKHIPHSREFDFGYEMDRDFGRGRDTYGHKIWSTDTDLDTKEWGKKRSDSRSQSDDQSSVSDEKNGRLSFLRYGTTSFVILIFLSGAGILGLGIYLMAYDYAPQDISIVMGDKLYQAAALIMLISGGCIVLLALCGCFGAARSSSILLGVFIVCTGVLVVTLIAGAIIAFVFRERMRNDMEPILLNNYGEDGSERITYFWDFMQKRLNCCGVSGDINSTTSWMIYKKSKWYQKSGKQVPDSCCLPTANINICTKTSNVTINTDLYKNGCYDDLADIIKFNSVLIGACSLAAALALVFVLVFAVCLYYHLRQKERRLLKRNKDDSKDFRK
ncbi:hypothetical protein CHS0354_015025 [Potamilus streckersoni]|uniref:Tetraspanin n=1 Tax=Potamilus streckersoni TaxID=2493646 RepID=A0AAE0T1K7_9BIVA|nr:hypothetical protein CHS0354_015025 [Potamilus streckersoni]